MPNEYDHALVVGINDYQSFPALQGAVNDADNFYNWLTSTTGGDVPTANTRKIVSGGAPAEPRRDQVENEILTYIEKYFTEGDPIGRRLYIFLAGHGIDVGALEDCGLVMADATTVATDRTIPGRRLATAFKQSHAFNEVVLFMDCCREVQMINPPTGELPILGSLPKLEGSPSRMLHGLATQWRQQAGERVLPNPDADGESAQGIFTYALLDGLRRAGGENGEIMGDQLRNYVQRFMALLGDHGQTPTIAFEPEDIVVCTPGQGSTSVMISMEADLPDFDVRDGAKRYQRLDVAPVAISEHTWAVALRPGLYYIGTPGGREIGGYKASQEVTVVGREFVVKL